MKSFVGRVSAAPRSARDFNVTIWPARLQGQECGEEKAMSLVRRRGKRTFTALLALLAALLAASLTPRGAAGCCSRSLVHGAFRCRTRSTFTREIVDYGSRPTDAISGAVAVYRKSSSTIPYAAVVVEDIPSGSKELQIFVNI
jgi:hypothetical protein